MSPLTLILVGIALFVVAYRFYGAFLNRKFDVDRERPTPAHTLRDGVDYVPAKTPILLGHHFASIAGAGPILGPIFASIFGWVPVFIWIVVGGIFFGGVHDMSSMIASVRHSGGSIGQIIENYMGRRGKILFLIFAYLTMILVIAVFCRIVAKTFVDVPAVATSSILFIVLAVLFGMAIYRRNLPLLPTTVIGVILLFLCIHIGSQFPLTVYSIFTPESIDTRIADSLTSGELSAATNPSAVANFFTDNGLAVEAAQVMRAAESANTFWIVILLIYVFIAATTPVWILLQPRDYLNSFLLYALLFGGVIGILFARPVLNLPGYTHFSTDLGLLFPVLFVTVACGAISGFHSLVASGTTAKQIDRETDAKPVGYGGMLIESVLAILALLAAATLSHDRFTMLYSGGQIVQIFSEGLGAFMSKIPLLGISPAAAITFSGLAVSAFALTSLDTCTRLARFAFQEFFDKKESAAKSPLVTNRFIGTAFTVLVSAVFIFSGSSTAIWPIFGSANQLLAALALLAVTAWLTHQRKSSWFTKIPMVFMYVVTLTALVTLIRQNLIRSNYPLVAVGIFLVIVAILLGIQGSRKVFGRQSQTGKAAIPHQ
ncbi:carbon starvation protein A [candidate division KSB1 bacterium]|nr:carbon starvation protein A [candidate division KSB1 bacterium]